MAEHEVHCDIGHFDVGRVDVIFSVVRNARQFGRLKVSQGGVEWMQRYDKKIAHELSWRRIDEIFTKRGRKVKTRSKR